MIHVFSITVTSTLPVAATRQVWKVDATAGVVTATLPDATLCRGAEITVVKVDVGANAVTVARSLAQTIVGTAGAAQTSLSLATLGKAFTVVSDGTNWVIVGAV